jgi:hypothetical protein
LDSIAILNSLSAQAANHIAIARNGDAASIEASWAAFNGSLFQPVLEIEGRVRAKLGLGNSHECGSAVDLLEDLKDGSLPFDMEKGLLGSYLSGCFFSDCVDEIRKIQRRSKILGNMHANQARYRKSQGPTPAQYAVAYETLLGLIRKMPPREAKVAAILWAEPIDVALILTTDEFERLAEISPSRGPRAKIGQTQIAGVLGVGEATICRDVMRIHQRIAMELGDIGDTLVIAM